MTTFRFLQVRREGAVERVVLNRPDVRNAFNDEVVAELTEWASRAAHDPGLRVAILAGAGKVFCAGADLEWMTRTIGYSNEENARDAAALAAMFEALDALPIALVGRIHGAALAGGAGLAAVCDIAIASEDAVFGFTEVKLGLLPAVIAPYVVAKIGRSAARELFLTGARFPALHAREIGLVHGVVPAGVLDETVDAYVRELRTSGPQAIAAAKTLLQQIAGRRPADAKVVTSEAIARRRTSEEGQEGMRAFLEKRKASWCAGPSDTRRS